MKPAATVLSRAGFITQEPEVLNRMRNPVFTLALGSMLALGAATTTIYAQDTTTQPQAATPQQGQWGHGPRRMDPDRQLQHMTKALNLSSDQQTQIKPILQERQQKMQALWQDQSLSREDRHSKAQEIQQDTHSKIEAVLNDEQKQKFETMQQRMRGHHQGMQGGSETNPPAGSPQPQ